jgi:hypothetical protein
VGAEYGLTGGSSRRNRAQGFDTYQQKLSLLILIDVT